jgi:CDP-glycerol glycerophosphotransferase
VPILSLIVPVHRVQDFLGECLDSILRQAGDALPGDALPGDAVAGGAPAGDAVEIVAVDDASPDRCGEILRDYATRDPRVRVVTLAENQGLGAARNVGLDHAAGDYVWFIDSDDWLTAGALSAVLDRLRRSRPDVLVVGYERAFADGRLVAPRLVDLDPGAPPLPDVFSLAERPEALRSLHIACNKVVRRSFLTDLGVRFESGWYEDVSFSHPVLLAARRIAVLDRICYGYRQRESGAITRTRTERHVEVFGQWHRVFDFLDRYEAGRATGPRVRSVLFERMIWHYLAVLNHPDRVPRHQRRSFFRAIVEDYRTYRPATGYVRPSGGLGVKVRLVELGAFRLFELARAVYRARDLVAAARRRPRRAADRVYSHIQRRLSMYNTVVGYAAGGSASSGYLGGPYALTPAEVAERVRAVAAARGLAPARPVLIVPAGARGSWRSTVECVGLESRAALRALARSRVVVADGALPRGVLGRPHQFVERVSARAATPALVPAPRTAAGVPGENASIMTLRP